MCTPASPASPVRPWPLTASQKIFRTRIPVGICCRAQNLIHVSEKSGTVSSGHLEHAMHAAVGPAAKMEHTFLNPVPSG